MRKIVRIIWLYALLAALLSGCGMTTVDELYSPPKRSEAYLNLQSSVDSAMTDLEYSAPRTGENQQTVQMADLDGDGNMEYLLFAKGQSELPLKVLIFRKGKDSYTLWDTIESYGAAFDQVEYVNVDDRPGFELVVGRQLSDQVVGSVSVYTFAHGKSEQVMTTNYTKFLACDLDSSGQSELLVFRPGESDEGHGLAERYSFVDGAMEKSVEAAMSAPSGNLRRILSGCLNDGTPAVYAASSVDEDSIITDVFALVNGRFTNVLLGSDAGTGVQTLRNYYVYAEDIDQDGVVELPDLIPMVQTEQDSRKATVHHLIRWYSVNPDGSQVDKLYTYHNFGGGWYLELDKQWAHRISVEQTGMEYAFFLWDEELRSNQKLMTIYAFSGQDRDEQSLKEGRILLYRTDAVVYAAAPEKELEFYQTIKESLEEAFHLIHRDWKTGET